MGLTNLLTAIEQANKLAQLFGLQFFAYVSDGEQKEHLASNLVLSDLETVIGGLREWKTGEIPEPITLCTLVIECTGGAFWCMNSVQDAIDGNYDSPEFKWVWDDWSGFGPNAFIIADSNCTGRWFIQPINLPCSDPTNQKP